ncbi:hypothetical protein NDU88_009196 [Pleurodeles waltl]|uniref:Endonuclease/exonuclease/phosphatase domain-containing protein n=1 Tax=Pleurodeles waltl TaxID=8319 RepID=A0AAV7PYT3_PLEWA|nr:hypothetical protein NDU88_009196 [Pleurodeles waltl]
MAHNHFCLDGRGGPGRIRLVTWNVHNDARKVRKIVAYLHRHKVDLAILQEMHLAPGSPLLTPRWLQGQFLAAGFTSQALGVLIWASRSSGISLQGVVVDQGRLCLLEQELAQLEQEHLHGADSWTRGHIHTKLMEFQDTALAEIEHLGKYATARAYGEGERPGSVLANLTRPNEEKSMIIAVQAEDGSEIRDPELLAAGLHEYYKSLYASRVASDQEALLDYLAHIAMPQLTDTDRESLMAPLPLE